MLASASRAWSCLLLGLAAWSAWDGRAAQPASSGLPAALAAPDARALLERYCYDCHGDGIRKSDIALDEMIAAGVGRSHGREWEKAWKMVRQEFMPPAGETSPSLEERRAIEHWIEQRALGVNHAQPDPGRVTIRRLNRMEYEYSVSDLFGKDFSSAQHNVSDNKGDNADDARLRDRLPPDDTAFGFDNNGDFMSLSPALLEKFFNIAESVVNQAIVQDGPRHPVRDIGKKKLKVAIDEQTRAVAETGAFVAEHAGRHRLDLRFTVGDFSEVAGTFELVVVVDEKEILRDEVEVGGHRTHHYAKEIALEAGPHTWAFRTRPSRPDSLGKTMHRGRINVMDPLVHADLTGPIGSGIYEYPESHRQIFFAGPAPAEPEARRAYAREIVRRVADRAFRRPADAATLDRLAAIALRQENFERGVGQALTAILASPRFLFRAEPQPLPDDPKAIHPIDEFALASRLSYLLWLSLPDAELTELAAAGRLRANLPAQLARMLADRKSARFFEDFPGQWLRTRNVLMTANSRERGILDPLREPMKRETEMLFEHIARNDRDLLEIITADYTFANRKLAEFYGLKDAVKGGGFEKVALPPGSHRGGVLAQGSFLVSTSNPNRTSPVKRGLYVLDTFWGTQPPSPPADIPPLDDAKAGGLTPKTVREQLAIHRENKACAACHAHFDPIGIVLENFDLIGRWRDTEAGEKIAPREETTTGATLTGLDDLRQMLARRPDRFYRGITEKLLTYAIGRGLEPADASTVDAIADRVAASGGKFSTLLLAMVESPAFQLRRGDDGAAKEMPHVAKPTPPTTEQLAELRERKRAARAAAAPVAQKSSSSEPAKPADPNEP